MNAWLRTALLLLLFLGQAVQGASDPATGASSPSGAGGPSSSLPPSTSPPGIPPAPATPVPAPPASSTLPLPGNSAMPAPPAPAPGGQPAAPAPATDPAPVVPAPPAPSQPPRRAPASLLDQPALQAAPPQWRGVLQSTPRDLPPLREWLVISRNLSEAETQRRALQPYQLGILRRQQLPNLRRVITVYRIPAQLDLPQLERDLRRQFPQWQQELNQRHTPLTLPLGEQDEQTQQLRTWGQRALGRVQPAPAGCGRGLSLAMLDGPVNNALAEFAGADLHYHGLTPVQSTPRAADAARHGTSLAALLLGRQQVAGLLPGARLQALGVFGEDHTGLHTRSDWVVQALDHLAGIQPPVQVVNLSFGGSHSRLLEQFFQQLARSMVFVAAAGNDGVEGIRYPAAYPSVLAVGAVDARLRRLRQSNYGPQLALMAPGEDIWTLDEQGQGYFASGTSFAAPFVTAALALASSADLSAQARDLGDPGQDPVYGDGLVLLPECR